MLCPLCALRQFLSSDHRARGQLLAFGIGVPVGMLPLEGIYFIFLTRAYWQVMGSSVVFSCRCLGGSDLPRVATRQGQGGAGWVDPPELPGAGG